MLPFTELMWLIAIFSLINSSLSKPDINPASHYCGRMIPVDIKGPSNFSITTQQVNYFSFLEDNQVEYIYRNPILFR